MARGAEKRIIRVQLAVWTGAQTAAEYSCDEADL